MTDTLTDDGVPFAIARAARASRRGWRFPPAVPRGAPPLEVCAALIADGEAVSVEEANRRLSALCGGDDPLVVVNGLPSRVAQLISAGHWSGSSRGPIRRRPPPPAPAPHRCVFRPRPNRTVDERLAALEAGSARPPVVAPEPRAGHVFVRNPFRHELHCTLLGRSLGPLEVVEVTEEVAATMCQTGVFQTIAGPELAAAMAGA